MMVDGAEEGQLKGPIDFLAPYTYSWRQQPVSSSFASPGRTPVGDISASSAS